MAHGWYFWRRNAKKIKSGECALGKVKGQELAVKGIRLIKSKVKDKVSCWVDLVFSNQSGFM